MNALPNAGLRERKRARTAEAIHMAAVELVLERGLDLATIDAISERADVSTRTFFNYYPSKEDAVLGIDDVAVADELAQAPDEVDDPLLAVFDLLYTLFEAGGGTHNGSDLTREAVLKNPQLITRQILRVTELEGRLTEIISRWLAGHPGYAADSEAERLEAAEVLLGMCLATVRVGMRRRASQPADPADPTHTHKTYERSVATLRTVMEKLT